jgi:hypothetical protein
MFLNADYSAFCTFALPMLCLSTAIIIIGRIQPQVDFQERVWKEILRVHYDSNVQSMYETLMQDGDFIDSSHASREETTAIRKYLTPYLLEGCRLVRYGPPSDGGYLMCGGEFLSHNITAIYHFGIEGRDKNGCKMSKTYNSRLYQFDCFTTATPPCDITTKGMATFAPECIGPKREVVAGRTFNTLENQINANGDGGKEIMLLVDVEGAEYDSLLTTPDHTFEHITQLSMELHDIDMLAQRVILLLKRLSRFFYVAHVHCNNFGCLRDTQLPCRFVEVLFVSKRLTRPVDERPLELPLPGLYFPCLPFVRDCPW